MRFPPVSLTATSHELLERFYAPAFMHSSLYQRGVAYFSIRFYLGMIDGLVEFVLNGGTIQLVTSVELDETTVAAVAAGYEMTESDIERRLCEKIVEYQAGAHGDEGKEAAKLDIVANMIAAGRLVVKVASVPTRGIYHEKIGLFTDDAGDSVSFIGSANETVNAFEANYETVNIFASWRYPEVVAAHAEHFRSLWNGRVDGVRVWEFPEALKAKIIERYRQSATVEEAVSRYRGSGHSPRTVGDKPLWPHQREAIRQFVENGYRHFYEMATGTGKTFTAIKSIERMMEDHPLLNVIILVPLKDLQAQWAEAVAESFKPRHAVFRFGGGGKSNPTDFNLATAAATTAGGPFASLAICVYDTFFGDVRKSLRPIQGETLVIVDEAHNLTPGNIAALQAASSYRLGLSATPERRSKAETASLTGYFLGSEREPFRFGLKEAIDAGFLSRYCYYPIPVELTQAEHDEYCEYTRRMAIAQGVYDRDPTVANRKRLDEVKIARSLVVKQSESKIGALVKMLNDGSYDFANSVVFCGPGCVRRAEGGNGDLIVDQVTAALARGGRKRYFPAKFTSREGDRPARLEHFKKGMTDVLVAVRCFDEGLDVPALDKIYIMSSDASVRQTIQRRGRVLRLSKTTGKGCARIYDMVAGIGSANGFIPLKAELPRVNEYARLSENRSESAHLLAGVREEELVADEAFSEGRQSGE